MGGVVTQILWGLLAKLVTQQFIAEFIVYGLRYVAKHTETDLDDKLVQSVAKAFGVNEDK